MAVYAERESPFTGFRGQVAAAEIFEVTERIATVAENEQLYSHIDAEPGELLCGGERIRVERTLEQSKEFACERNASRGKPVLDFAAEEHRPRWGARTSNPVKSVDNGLGGFDSCLFRHTI